jgi:hypothetical protein
MADEPDDAEYVNVETASDILGIVTRMVHRYGEQGRLRRRRLGRRMLFHRGDVDALAVEIDAVNKVRAPATPRSELIPIGETLEHIQRLQSELSAAMRRVGQLEGTLEAQQHLLADADTVRQRLAAAEADAVTAHARLAAVEAELERMRRRAWWKRLLD